MLPEKIISGGQTGVDQAALDFAMERGMDCGGWCPKGRICETGRIPERYPLEEVEHEDYDERTRRNVRDSDATLVITHKGRMEEGTGLTIKFAQQLKKDFYHFNIEAIGFDAKEPGYSTQIGGLYKWISGNEIRILNIAGNRESTSPGINRMVADLLGYVWDYST